MILAEQVSFSYRGEPVLDQVSLTSDGDQIVGLIGPNGSGKTTLLKTLYAALEPHSGHVKVDDVPVNQLRPIDLARRIAVVPQETTTEIPVTVADMVLLGRAPHRSMFHSYTRSDHLKASAALQRMNVRHLAKRSFSTLSGGEKQRVMVARALTQEADHLLLDEPTNHLDIHYQHEILTLVRALAINIIIVLHDLNLAARYCDHVVLLDNGHVVTAGPPEEVLRPDILEQVYRVKIDRLAEPDCVQFIFRPNIDGQALEATQRK